MGARKAAMARVTSKGQVTLPKAVREALGIREGTLVGFEVARDTAVLRTLGLVADDPFGEAEWRALAKVARARGRRFRSAEAARRHLDTL